MDNSIVDVAIIGAGPYGLSIASHLKAQRVSFRIFGSPMQSWQDMPKGIALKSFDFATNIYTPVPRHRFVDYCKDRGIDSHEPVDMSLFIEYGLWAQRELVPEVEDIRVNRLAYKGETYSLDLDDGQQVLARRVVMAVGLGYYPRLPEVLTQLSQTRVSHTSSVRDYAAFSGQDVTIIGGGQSALEAAALLHKHGATARILIRGNGVWFSDKMADHRTLNERFRNPQSVMGPGRINWVLEHFPWLFYHVPEERRVRFTKRHLGPFGTWWLRDTIEGNVPIQPRTQVVDAAEADGRLRLTIRDDAGQRQIDTDHIVAGTGYEANLDRIGFIDPALAGRITRIEGAPRLSTAFESSVPGLYFVGPIASMSFGPIVRFVCGASFAAPTVARHLAKNRLRKSASEPTRVPVATSR